MYLYQVGSNYAPGVKNGPAPSHIVDIGLYRENIENIFLSETTKPRALIFGMQHHLVVDLYPVCSNYGPGAKIGPALGSHVLHRPIGRNMKTSSCLKPHCLESWYLV